MRAQVRPKRELDFQTLSYLSTSLAMQHKPDFVARRTLSSEYHRENKIAPWRCLNVTAILS
ncbi:MAG: hypothetical protein ABL897_14445, partial [Hyphomicrobium sp.]